jgi:DNA-binding transcriptional ArsR family regulator
MVYMLVTADLLFKTLADPTRRAIFERLCRDGEQTVVALTSGAGVRPEGRLRTPNAHDFSPLSNREHAVGSRSRLFSSGWPNDGS